MKIVLWTMVVSCGAACAARADTVDLACIGNGNGRMVQATLGRQTWDVFAGRLIHQTSGGTGALAGAPSTIVTFCAEILQGQAPTLSPYSLSSVATLSGNTGATNLGYVKQQAIYDIYAQAAGRQFSLGLDYACAFQIALWEVIYDYNTAPGASNPLDLNGGNFRIAGPGGVPLSTNITLVVKDLLGHVGSNSAAGGIFGLRSATYQDELYDGGGDVVPLPSAAWMGAGLLGMAIAAQRRYRR